MNKKSIKDVDVKGKRCLVRCDFNVPLKDGVITKQDITTGISSEDSVEITDGIKAGDEVIEDLGSLEEGMTAEAAPADGDSAAETGETANE